MDPQLQELITVAQAQGLVSAGAWLMAGAAVAALTVALLWRPARPAALTAAAALAPWSLALSAGWDVYLARVGYNPATGTCGLHSVAVMAANAAAAVALGVLYGAYLRWAAAAARTWGQG